jgi:hypothetical protein
MKIQLTDDQITSIVHGDLVFMNTGVIDVWESDEWNKKMKEAFDLVISFYAPENKGVGNV